MEEKNQNRGLMVVIVILLLVIIALICVIGYMVLDQKENNKISNQPEINNDTNLNVEDGIKENKKTILGLFEGSINGLDASGNTMTAYFKLNIKEDNSCEFSRSVSGGSGWTASGNCVIEDSKIILTSNEFQFDANSSSESKKYIFIINSENSISYEDALGNVTLAK